MRDAPRKTSLFALALLASLGHGCVAVVSFDFVQHGAQCDGDEDCGGIAGSCVFFDMMIPGRCLAPCPDPSFDCARVAGPGSRCFLVLADDTLRCSESCTPGTGSGCLPGWTCRGVGELTYCTPPSDEPIGAPCSGLGDCVAGASCWPDAEGVFTCREQCASFCAASMTCRDTGGEVAAGEAGVCIPDCDSSGDECRVLPPQCGCGSGENCFVSGSAVACIAAGPAGLGENCTSTACAAGLGCLGSRTANLFRCVRWCASDADCADLGRGSVCEPPVQLSENTSVGYCSASCTPGTPTGCPAGWTCIGVNAATGCSVSGTTARGASCETAGTFCAPGDVCWQLSDSGESRCLRNCSPGIVGCDPGEQCMLDLETPTPVGEWGACAPMS